MNARVKSSLYGSGSSTRVELDDITRTADECNHIGFQLQAQVARWQNLPTRISRYRFLAPLCPAWSTGAAHALGSAYGAHSPTLANQVNTTTELVYEHVAIESARLQQLCTSNSEEFAQISVAVLLLADKLTQAHSLYSHAEHTVDRIINEGIELGVQASPKYAALGFGVLAAIGVIRGSIVEGRFNPIYALTDTWWAQEGFLAGISNLATTGSSKQSMIFGVLRKQEVNNFASKITTLSAPINNKLFGDTLTVQEIFPKQGVSTTTSIADSLTNVHDMRLHHVDYGSIAIEEFKQADGTRSWMVTIPGTDGHFDSPFSWQTNIELMSSKSSQRKLADSTRMVDEAMTMAGIQPGEPVAMVGHSQGGIVAATMAADFSDKYTISHIVTAGSPIANHPMPKHTWVTSIEMNDELVSNLDGSRNPMSDTWLTVRGTSTPPLTGYHGNTPSPNTTASTSCGQPSSAPRSTLVPTPAPAKPTSSSSATSPALLNTQSHAPTYAPSNTSSVSSMKTPDLSPTLRNYAYFSTQSTGTEVEHSGDRKFLSHEMWYMKAAWKDAQQLGSPDLARHEQHFDQIVQGEHVQTKYYRGRISKN